MRELKRTTLRGQDKVFTDGERKVKVWINKRMDHGSLILLFKAFDDQRFEKPADDPHVMEYSHTIHRDGLADADVEQIIKDEAEYTAERYLGADVQLAKVDDIPEWKVEDEHLPKSKREEVNNG